MRPSLRRREPPSEHVATQACGAVSEGAAATMDRRIPTHPAEAHLHWTLGRAAGLRPPARCARALPCIGMDELPIRGDVIRLGQLLKLAGLADSGAEAKALLAEGGVAVN